MATFEWSFFRSPSYFKKWTKRHFSLQFKRLYLCNNRRCWSDITHDDVAVRWSYDCEMPIHKFDNSTVACETYFLPPEKLIAGNPKQSLWMHYTDASKKFFAGIWVSEIGKWRITYTEEEYCKILEGTSVITDTSGHAVTLTAGDAFVLPSGFSGTWEVVVPTRKEFVIYEPGA